MFRNHIFNKYVLKGFGIKSPTVVDMPYEGKKRDKNLGIAISLFFFILNLCSLVMVRVVKMKRKQNYNGLYWHVKLDLR